MSIFLFLHLKKFNMRKLFYVLFIASFLIYSCNKDHILGKNILPKGDDIGIEITDTVTLKMYTEKSEPLNTTSPSYFLLGKLDDPVFGTTEASFITQVFQKEYPEWSDSAVFDSICLGLPTPDDFQYGGDAGAFPEVTVYKITDTLKNKLYYSNENPDNYTDYTVLGHGYMRRLKHNVLDKNGNIIKILNVGLQVRLSDSLGLEFWNNSSDYFESYGAFYDLFKGIYVKCDNSVGLFKFSSSSVDSIPDLGLVIYYHEPNNPDSAQCFTLPITSQSVKFNIFSHDYTTGTINNIIESDTAILSDKVYLQSMAGTMIRLTAPGLRNLKNIAVINADLILETDQLSSVELKPIPEVWLALFDSTKTVAYLSDYLTESRSYEGAQYNVLTGQYKLNVTRVVQNYIDSVYKNQDLTLYIYDYLSKSDFQRSIIYNGLDQEIRSKLVITYTKIK